MGFSDTNSAHTNVPYGINSNCNKFLIFMYFVYFLFINFGNKTANFYFYPWGYEKSKVFVDKPATIQVTDGNITRVLCEISVANAGKSTRKL